MRAVQVKPAFLRDFALGYSRKHSRARFGCQQIIMMFAGSAFRSVKPNGDQFAWRVVNQRKIHSRSEFVGVRGDAI